MLILKFLHILAMFSAVTLIFGGVVFLDVAARTRDVVTYRRLYAVWERSDTAALVLFVAGIVFGFLTAITGGFDLTASWLVLAYVIVVAIFVDSTPDGGRRGPLPLRQQVPANGRPQGEDKYACNANQDVI